MRRYATLLALSASAFLAVSCANAKAQVMMPDSGPLAMPAAPAHVVVPAAPEPPPAPVVEAPAQTAAPPAAAATNGTRPRTDPPSPRPTPPVTPPAAVPQPQSAPTQLETSPNQSELEKRARDLRDSAERTMDKIDYKSLSADARAQYDTAKRFIKQTDDALKAKNIVYAWQLADKANTIATLLR